MVREASDRPNIGAWNMPLYEHVFLARQDLAQAQVDALAENATKIIADNGGSVVKTETWTTALRHGSGRGSGAA